MENKCDCGSGFPRHPLYDGYGIFLTYVCEVCEATKLEKFRPDIMTRYETDETIDDDSDTFLNPNNEPTSEHNQWEDSNDVDC